MESADIGCAFRETFAALRTNLRHGLRTSGQVYALEMDACIPGQLLDTTWLPPSAHGLPADTGGCPPGADAAPARHALLRRLLSLPGAPALLVWVGERAGAGAATVLRVEVVSADGLFRADHPVQPGQGWRVRDLVRAPHRADLTAP